MAINRTYNYNDLRSEVTREIKGVVSEGATQGLTEGMAEALAHGLKGKIKINGNNIVFDDGDLKDGIRVAFNKALNDFDIKDVVKKQGLDISQLFNIDTNVLKQEIQDSLAEVDINPKSIKANKKLLGQLLAAEFRGIEVKDLDGATITQSFIQSIQRAAKISNEQIADINDGFKQLGDSSKQLDVFAENVTELLIRMQNAADGINDTKREISEFNKLLEGLDDQSFDKINDSLDEFQEKIQKGVMSASEAFAELKTRFNLDAVADDLKEFNGLLDMALTGFGSKSKPSAQQYWKNFSEGFEAANEDVKDLLKNLGLLNQSGGVDIIESGANNYGGIVGEQNTAIIRKNNGNITPENALELKNALDQAADAGVNCGRIIDVVSDKTNEFFVEVQSTQAGKAISTIGDEFESINTAALEASDEQIQKLFSDLKKLYDLGIQIDPENLTNILYDPAKGFGFIDLDLGKGNAAFESFEEMISAFRTTLGYQVDDIKTILDDETGSKLMEGFVKRIVIASSGIGDAVEDLQRAGLDELAKSLDSHSPSKKAENIGESVPQGEAKGIRNEIPEAEKAAKELGRATMDALKKELEPVSGNQYADVLNRSFETKNKTEANNQLKTAFEEYQKYFGEKGLDKHKIIRDMSDAGREAGFNYIKALEEAVSKGVAKNRISKYLIDDFRGVFDEEQAGMIKGGFSEYIHEQARILQELGSPELNQAGMKALSDYMERWDLLRAHQGDTDLFNDEDIRNDTELLRLMREELESVIKAKQQAVETKLTDEQEQFKEQNKEIKIESDAHAENTENIRKEAEAKKESEQHSPTPNDAAQVKAEADAHAENAEQIQKEAEAKKETVSTNTGLEAYEARYEFLKSAADGVHQAYEEALAREKELSELQASLMNTIENGGNRKAYDDAFRNARKYNLSVDDLYKQAVEHTARGSKTLDADQFAKGAAYYQQYVDALKNTDQEIQKVVVDGQDLSSTLLESAKSYAALGGADEALEKLKGVNLELVQTRDNLEKSKAPKNKADIQVESFAKILEKEREYQARQNSDSSEEVANAEKAADAEQKKAEAIKESTDAKEKEQAAGDNSKVVEQEQEEEAAIEKKTAARERSLEVKKEEQKSGDNSKAIEQNNREAESLNKLRAAAERRAQQQREAQNVSATTQAPVVIKAEDLSPVLMQLTNIIGLLERKNNLFIREGSIVAEQAAKEVGSLKEVAEVVASIVKNLQEASSKKINISFKGLESLNTLVGKDLTGIVSALQSLAKVGEVNMSVKTNGIKGLEALTNLNLDKLQDRLDEAWIHIDDFAKNLNAIQIKDDSLFNALNNLMKDGEKLKNLATALKASKKQIDNVTEAISKPKEQSKTKVDLSAWKELKGAVQEYYELRAKGHEGRTEAEKQRLHDIYQIWNSIKNKVQETTEALKAQGQSTKLVEDVTRAYTTGFEEWQQQRANDKKNSVLTAANKKAEQYQKNLDKYPTKYLEGVTDKLVELQGLLKSLEGKSINLVKPEELQQVEQLTSDIEKMMASAEWRTANEKKIGSIANEINQYRHQWTGMGADFETQFANLEKAARSAKSQMDLDNVIRQFNDLKSNVRDAGKEVKSFWTRLGEQVQHTNDKLLGTYLSFQDIIRYTREAAQAVIELDSALTELRKVSDESTERLAVSFQKSAATAKELGSTVDSVINQTADWSRLGFKIDEAEDLARITTLFQTVGDNMTTETASQAMISTLKGFEMSANQAEDIVDKYNIIARVIGEVA